MTWCILIASLTMHTALALDNRHCTRIQCFSTRVRRSLPANRTKSFCCWEELLDCRTPVHYRSPAPALCNTQPSIPQQYHKLHLLSNYAGSELAIYSAFIPPQSLDHTGRRHSDILRGWGAKGSEDEMPKASSLENELHFQKNHILALLLDE